MSTESPPIARFRALATTALEAKWRIVALVLVLGWGLVLRAYMAPLESPWYDELLTLEPLGASFSLPEYLENLKAENQPTQPGYFALLYGWGRVFGTGYLAARYLSIALGMVSLLLVYLIGRRIEGHATGIVAALGVASAQAHIEYSLEIRMYMLTFACAMLSMYTLLKLLERPSVAVFGVHLLSTVGLVWSHALGVVLLPVEALAWLVWGVRSWRWQLAWFGGQLAAAGSLAFWYFRVDQSKAQEAVAWLELPTIWFNDIQMYTYSEHVSLVGTLYLWLASTNYGAGIARADNFVPVLVYGGLIATALGVSIQRLVLHRGRNVETDETSQSRRKYVLWLVAWWILPPISLFILSHVWRPAYISRYVLYSMVPPFLLAGWAISQLKPPFLRRAGVAAVVLAAVFLGYANTRMPQRQPWAQALEDIKASGGAANHVVLYSNSDFTNRTAYRTVAVIDPGWAGRLRGATNTRELAARVSAVTGDVPLHLAIIGSGPIDDIDRFLARRNLVFTTAYYPSHFPLTVYRITGFGRVAQ